MADYIFRRKEQKYLLNEVQTAAFRVAMAEFMEPDTFATSAIRNIYYDTPDYRLIRRSLEKPVYKEKLRLRAYGDVTREGKVFLEMKKKYKGVVYKRRIRLKENQAVAYMADPDQRLEDTQIGRELDYFKTFYKELFPALYLSYDRMSWRSHDKQLRITMDWNICYRIHDVDLKIPPSGEQLLQPGQTLVEIKAPGTMPMWLARVLSENQIRQISFSKYGTAYQRLLREQKIQCRGANYAGNHI